MKRNGARDEVAHPALTTPDVMVYRCAQVRGGKQLAKQVRGLHDAESAAADLRAAVRELPNVATTVRETKTRVPCL